MKMAIEFKKDENQLTFILHTLKIRGYKIEDSSNKWCYWIYNLRNVKYLENYIQIEKEDFETTEIYLSNIEYFEIHTDNNKEK